MSWRCEAIKDDDVGYSFVEYPDDLGGVCPGCGGKAKKVSRAPDTDYRKRLGAHKRARRAQEQAAREDVIGWEVERLVEMGVPVDMAHEAARRKASWHDVYALIQQGATPEQAARIV